MPALVGAELRAQAKNNNMLYVFRRLAIFFCKIIFIMLNRRILRL